MQITSDRDRVPRARCSRRKKEGGEDGSGEERSDERCSGRRRDELNGGKEGGKGRSESDDDVQKREIERVHVHTCVCMYTRRETRPIVIAIPTGEMFLQCAVSCRPATKPERGLILLFALVPSDGATGCTTFHLPSGLPPAIHAIHIHTSRTRPRTLFVRTVNRGREREIERKRKEREKRR